MKRLSIYSLLFLLLSGCAVQRLLKNNWVQLFNGKDLKDWNIKIKGHPLNDNWRNTFRVEDGLLKVRYDQYKSFNEDYGHIFYRKKFSYYIIAAEYRFIGQQTTGGPKWAYRNNGIMIHCQDPSTMGLNQDFPISIEVQLLGGNGKDARSTANVCTPGTNIVKDGKLITVHSINSTSPTFHGDQWVRVEAVVLGDSLIRHYVNGKQVIEYGKPQMGGGNVSGHDPKIKIDGMPLTSGFIALQSESHPTDFRKVELFDLSPYRSDPAKLNAVINQLINNQ